MRSIDKSREVEAHRLLYALNIPLCGIDVCKRLLSAYSLDDLVAKASPSSSNGGGVKIQEPLDLFAPVTNQTSPPSEGLGEASEIFAHVNGIGPEKSAQFVQWFRDSNNLARYRRLKEKLTIKAADTTPAGDLCKDLTFVITGDVHRYKNRNELKAYIESQGGKVASAVSGSTSYLINNDVTSTSGKNKKAQQLGIPIISEDDFVARYTAQ
jgi:DNA ligase (NAD+)